MMSLHFLTHDVFLPKVLLDTWTLLWTSDMHANAPRSHLPYMTHYAMFASDGM